MTYFTSDLRLTAETRGQMDNLLVIRNAAVDDSLLAGVHNDERQVDDRVGWGWPVGLLLCLAVSLHQILEGNLLKKMSNQYNAHISHCQT